VAADVPTPEQLDALMGWADDLRKYASRAWRLCGTEPIK
jgi:hypothetical protein